MVVQAVFGRADAWTDWAALPDRPADGQPVARAGVDPRPVPSAREGAPRRPSAGGGDAVRAKTPASKPSHRRAAAVAGALALLLCGRSGARADGDNGAAQPAAARSQAGADDSAR